MRHRDRIALLTVLFLLTCILTVVLFRHLPARPNGAASQINGSLYAPVTHELGKTLALVSPKNRRN